MKKTIILSVIFLGLVFQSSAQLDKLELGGEIGPGISTAYRSNIYYYYLFDFEPVVGMYTGATVQYNFSKYFVLKTGVGIERKGMAFRTDMVDDFGNSTGRGYQRFNYDYLTLPVLLRLKVGDKLRFNANAGFYLSFLIHSSNVFKGDNFPTKRSQDKINKMALEYGPSAGVGLSFKLKDNLILSAELRNSFPLRSANMSVIKPSFFYVQTNFLVGILGCSYQLKTRD